MVPQHQSSRRSDNGVLLPAQVGNKQKAGVIPVSWLDLCLQPAKWTSGISTITLTGHVKKALGLTVPPSLLSHADDRMR
jgi:hypothetical protein